MGARCGAAEEQCEFTLSGKASGEVIVHVEFFEQDQRTGDCLQYPGGFEAHVYDANGKYIETLSGA